MTSPNASLFWTVVVTASTADLAILVGNMDPTYVNKNHVEPDLFVHSVQYQCISSACFHPVAA